MTDNGAEDLWSDSDDDCMILDHPPVSVSTKKKEIPVVKVNSTKKITQWVASSFDDFGDFGPAKPEPKRSKTVQPTVKSSLASQRSLPLKRKLTNEGDVGSYVSSVNRVVSRRADKAPETDLWSDKFAPKTQADLAVHKKKIGDVEQWINTHINKKGLPPILLLTGPAGTGKTATVKVLSKELGCELHEWTNQEPEAFDRSGDDWKSRSRLDMATSSSQLSLFREFLLRASKYNTLDIFGGGVMTRKIICVELSLFREFLLRASKYNTLDIFGGGVMTRKIICVEDFPNTFYRDAAPFHDILRKYVQVGNSPLIFIVSDSTSGESTERLLFPKNLQDELHIDNISFNPVAMTSMSKILTKIATEESLKGSHKFTVPSKTVIESIAMASSGDIRGAINALQFACLKDTGDMVLTCISKGGKSKTKKPREKTSKKSSMTKTKSFETDAELSAIGGRDTSLFLFRALGKILYCKRDEPSPDSTVALPSHLSHCYRDPLLVNPEDVIERSHLSGDYFGAYLHQNYLEFYSTIEDVVMSSEYLSDADYLTIDWASRSVLQQYAASVAARSVMFCNTSRAHHNSGSSGLGWKPLHKPQWYIASKTSRQNCENARHLFRSLGMPPTVLQTEMLPYISMINTTLHDTGQISFLHEICRFSTKRPESYERLDEKDVDLDEGGETQILANQSAEQADDIITNSQSNVKASQEVEEEYEIEDFDD